MHNRSSGDGFPGRGSYRWLNTRGAHGVAVNPIYDSDHSRNVSVYYDPRVLHGDMEADAFCDGPYETAGYELKLVVQAFERYLLAKGQPIPNAPKEII